MKFIHVVAGIIEKDKRILLAKRPEDKHQGGLWEFPGGKVEDGETSHEALKRELKEEVNIDIKRSHSFLKIHHQYPDKAVFLDIYKVEGIEGKAKGLEGQELAWVGREDLNQYRFPAANKKIVTALQAHEVLSITPADIEELPSINNLLSWKDKINAHGISALLLRAPLIKDDSYISLYHRFKTFLKAESLDDKVSLIINRQHLLDACDATCLHLSAKDFQKLPSRPENIFLSTSCHSESEIKLAEEFACNQIFISPVLTTKSHPSVQALGWDNAKLLVQQNDLPVLLLGGMKPEDLLKAKEVGALGVAGISSFF